MFFDIISRNNSNYEIILNSLLNTSCFDDIIMMIFTILHDWVTMESQNNILGYH